MKELKQLVKKITALFIFTILTQFGYSQVSARASFIIDYAKRVKSFDEKTIISTREDSSMHEVDLKNGNGDLLRFKIDENDSLLTYHCGLCFILYHFDKELISKITTFGKNGNIKGDLEFDDIAIVRFKIMKPEELKAKLVKIDKEDGNIEMNDATEHLVLQTKLNSKNEVLEETYISSSEYWQAQNLFYRP
jgi:hypothetical protein